MVTTTLPSPKAVKDLFEGLLGRDIEVQPCGAPEVGTSAALGLYVNDHGRMTAVVTLDLPLAAYVGTSIALIPPGGAEAAIEDTFLSDAIFANVGEILNVFAAVLNECSTEHQRLMTTYRGVNDAPADARTLAVTFGNRLDLSVEVQKYGSGVLSCVLV